MVSNLRNRLELKSFEKGKLYFKMEKYRSANIALNTTILEFLIQNIKRRSIILNFKIKLLIRFQQCKFKKNREI